MTSENSYINKQVGNYRVVSELANGTFGRVYLAQHVLLKQRIVAIKLLHAIYLGSPEERERFLQEAQFLEQLKHPYILPIIDVSIEGGLPYLVAEFAPNGSLRDRIKSCSPHLLPSQETLTILIQIGQALQYAHQQKIIHRDLKPENILFNAKNEALLADFGLATSVSTVSMKHVDNAGTPRYMAPEQFRGHVSKESDQYALACIAYELVTGHQPFTDQDIFTLAFKHLTEEPIPPTQLNPDLPIAVEQVILKAMSKERADRYPDVASFITQFVNSAASQLHSLTSPLEDFPSVEDNSFTRLKSTIPTLIPANTYNSSLRTTKSGTYESNHSSATLDDRQYNTVPQRTNVNPITPIPPSNHLNPITPIPLLNVDKQGLIGAPPAGALVNTTQFAPPKGWSVNNTPQKRKPRWLFIAIACMVVFASVLGIFVIPGFISHGKTPNPSIVKPAKLVIQASTLDFGKPEKGIKAILPIEIDNTGEQPLKWTTATGGAAWLTLNPSTGSIEPGRYQLIYVTADTSQLALKAYTATIAINSNGGNGVVAVKLNVRQSNPHKQAILNINPSSLNFGTLGANTQTTLAVTVGNVGNLALSWKANITSATWLTINNTSGTVQPGGLPQQIQVTANTSQLATGRYLASLTITSNGSNTTVQATLVVNTQTMSTSTSKSSTPTPLPTSIPTPTPTSSPTPTPTPTPSPTPTPTPSPTPSPITETLPTLYFTDTTGVTSQNSYTGQITITVSGTGNAASATPNSSDAFYIFLDSSGNPVNPPLHKSCWALEMYINNQWTENFVSPTPTYQSSHSYTFSMTAPGGPLSFIICDGNHSDNGGYLNITVTGSVSNSSTDDASSTSNIQVLPASTDILSEENKKISPSMAYCM